MSDPPVLSLNRLPLEILHTIFHYIDIPDILRIRRVSRCLNWVSLHRDVWSDAYRKADFVRPPGPLRSQSAHDLEQALISSFRVDWNLRHGGGPAQSERWTLKLREIRLDDLYPRVSLVFGQFLLILLGQEVHCYDLNLGNSSAASIIYRSTDGILRSFYCVSAFDVSGRPFACVVLSEETQITRKFSIHSLKAEEKSGVTLDLLHQFEHSTFDIVDVNLGPRAIVILGRKGNVHDPEVVALDVHTRTQLLLPSIVHAMQEAVEVTEFAAIQKTIPPTSVSTSTHLLLAMSFNPPAGWSTFFWACTLPPLHANPCLSHNSVHLSVSHRGVIPGIVVRGTIPLRDSFTDPSTQDILIAIRVKTVDPTARLIIPSEHGILRLITAHISHGHEVGTITFRLLGSLDQLSRTQFLYPSFNGISRAFYTQPTDDSSGTISAFEYDLRANGTNDDEYEAKVTEYSSILKFPTQRTLLAYDPYSGRMCLQSYMTGYSMVEVLDLAV